MADDYDDCEAGSRTTLLKQDKGRLQQYAVPHHDLSNVTLLLNNPVNSGNMMVSGAGSVAFHNVSYEVVDQKKCKKLPPRTIMYNVK